MASPPLLVPDFLVDKMTAAPVVTVEKPSTFDRLAYPSNCGKKQRSVLLFSIVAAVSTGAPQAGMSRAVFLQVTHCQLPAFLGWVFPKAPFLFDRSCPQLRNDEAHYRNGPERFGREGAHQKQPSIRRRLCWT